MNYIITDEQLNELQPIFGSYTTNEIRRRLTTNPLSETVAERPVSDGRQHTHRTQTPYEFPVLGNTNTTVRTTERIYGIEQSVINTSLEEIERSIIAANPRAIKLERMFNNRPSGETIKEFLEKFFTVWNNNRNTIYADDGSIQTVCGKRRSLGDIYMVCKYYYPRVTLKEVATVLYNELPEVITGGFRSSWCTQILKRVWYYDPEQETECLNKTRNDEYGVPHRWWIEQLSRTAVTA